MYVIQAQHASDLQVRLTVQNFTGVGMPSFSVQVVNLNVSGHVLFFASGTHVTIPGRFVQAGAQILIRYIYDQFSDGQAAEAKFSQINIAPPLTKGGAAVNNVSEPFNATIIDVNVRVA